MEWRHLKVMGDVGVVVPMPFSPRDARSIARAVEGSDIVINLCGKVSERRGRTRGCVRMWAREVAPRARRGTRPALDPARFPLAARSPARSLATRLLRRHEPSRLPARARRTTRRVTTCRG